MRQRPGRPGSGGVVIAACRSECGPTWLDGGALGDLENHEGEVPRLIGYPDVGRSTKVPPFAGLGGFERSNDGHGQRHGRGLAALPDQEQDPVTAQLGVVKPVQPLGDGNGFWLEPADYEGRSVNGIREAVAQLIDDDSPLTTRSPWEWAYHQAGDDNVYKNGEAPGTQTDWWARVITRYNDGTIVSFFHQHHPYKCPHDPDTGRC